MSWVNHANLKELRRKVLNKDGDREMKGRDYWKGSWRSLVKKGRIVDG